MSSAEWLRQSWLMLVSATIQRDKEKAWNRWYDESHLPEIVECPGFIVGARYVLDGKVVPEGYRPFDRGREDEYLAAYLLESPEALSTEEHRSRAGWGPFEPHVTYSAKLYRPR